MAVSPRPSTRVRLARLREHIDAELLASAAVVLVFVVLIAALVLSGALRSW